MTKVFVYCVVTAALHTASTIDREVFKKPYLTNDSFSCVEGGQKETNIALMISSLLQNKAIFDLGGLEFVQKIRICMFNWVT